MSSAIYNPAGNHNKPVCLEVFRNMTFVSSSLINPQTIELEYTNDLTETIIVTVTIPAPHTLIISGAGFVISRAINQPVPIEVNMAFDSDFSGNMDWVLTDFDNEGYLGGPNGIDKLYDFNIGLPFSLSPNAVLRGSTLLSFLGDTDPKLVGWQNIIDKDNIRFKYLPTASTGNITIVPTFTKRKIDTWYFDGVRYRNPQTGLTYTTLPANVTLSNCEDENQYITWNKELCVDYSPVAFRRINPIVYAPTDPYNNLLDRNDGIPGVFGIPPASLGWEFNILGTRVYSNDGTNVFYGSYDTETGIVTSLAGFPLLNMMPLSIGAPNLVGCAVTLSKDSEEYYVIHRQIAPNIIHIAKVNPLTGRLFYIGSTGLSWTPSGILDEYDLTFTKDGRLLYSHATEIYILDPNDAQVLGRITLTTANNASGYALGYISRLANGDILVSGADNANPHAWILDGGNLSIKGEWYFNSSPWTLNTPYLVAYPAKVSSKITRVFKQDIDTNQITFSDINNEGKHIQLTEFANVGECTTENDVSWSSELCYKSQILPNNLGNLGLYQASSLVAASPDCNPFTGFAWPGGTSVSITHDTTTTRLYALLNTGNINMYPWTTKTAPGAPVLLVVTGIPIAETALSIRTRWSNNSLWVHTQINATPWIHRFYEINKTTGVATLRGTLTLTGTTPIDTRGTFTWTLEDKLVFARIITNVPGITYEVTQLDISEATYSLGTSLFVAASNQFARIMTDPTTGNIIFMAVGNNRVEYYLTNGDKVSTCTLSAGLLDFLPSPSRLIVVNDSIKKVTRVFTKEAKTSKVSYYDLDPATGKPVQLSNNVQLFACDSIKTDIPEGVARVQQVNGIASWSVTNNAPNAKSLTFTRIANVISINDGVSPAFTVNAALSLSWNNLKVTNNLTFAGTAAGSIFIVSWTE